MNFLYHITTLRAFYYWANKAHHILQSAPYVRENDFWQLHNNRENIFDKVC